MDTREEREAAEGSAVDIYVPGILEVDGQLISHNVWVGGHRTSIRLEAVMWTALHDAARREGLTIHQLITIVAQRRSPRSTLTATVRAFLVAYFMALHQRGGDDPLLTTEIANLFAK